MAKRKRYVDHLHEIMSDDTPVSPATRPATEIQDDIAAISETLRGSLSNADRMDLIEARHHLRKQLSALSATDKSGAP